MRIFLDANILFSAAKSDGAVRALIGLLADGGHTCCVDAYVTGEVRRNLERKDQTSLEELDRLLRQMDLHATCTPAVAHPDLEWLPEKDRPVMAAAIRLGCDALVTGDRTHFGPAYGKSIAGVRVHSPRSLAEFLGLGGSDTRP